MPRAQQSRRGRAARRVVIAGAGVAALEASLALRRLDGGVEVELIAPETHFTYRPLTVMEPFAPTVPLRVDLRSLAERLGFGLRRDALSEVDARRHRVRTATGEVLFYDALLLAHGASPRDPRRGAIAFGGDPAGVAGFAGLLTELGGGNVRSVVFASPSRHVWSLPLYELALQTGAYLERAGIDCVELTVVTPEPGPLSVFGHAASFRVRRMLAEAGIRLWTGTILLGVQDGVLAIAPGGELPADRVVVVPELVGRPIAGIPANRRGFVPVDGYGSVPGVEGVFAAGDVTDFPLKQGGLAAQQAVVAARTIAAGMGIRVDPAPLRPVLQGLLVTGRSPLYMRTLLAPRRGAAGFAPMLWPTPVDQPERASLSEAPLWTPPAKVASEHLAAALAPLGVPEDPS